MKIGTTPKHTFELSIPIETVQNIKITYSQAGKTILEKYLKDCEVDGNTISVDLTQEETFMFDTRTNVHIQLRALSMGGDVLATDVYSIPAQRCLDDEVLK